MNRTWKPVAAGIIDVASGALSLLAGIAVLGAIGQPVAGQVTSYVMYSLGHAAPPTAAEVSTTILALGIGLMLPGALSIVGGILSLRRLWWPMALAGSIFTLLSSNPLGIPAVVLVALSRREFT